MKHGYSRHLQAVAWKSSCGLESRLHWARKFIHTRHFLDDGNSPHLKWSTVTPAVYKRLRENLQIDIWCTGQKSHRVITRKSHPVPSTFPRYEYEAEYRVIGNPARVRGRVREVHVGNEFWSIPRVIIKELWTCNSLKFQDPIQSSGYAPSWILSDRTCAVSLKTQNFNKIHIFQL